MCEELHFFGKAQQHSCSVLDAKGFETCTSQNFHGYFLLTIISHSVFSYLNLILITKFSNNLVPKFGHLKYSTFQTN